MHSNIPIYHYEQGMHMKLWAKKLYEHMSSQDENDFISLGLEKVNPVKLGNVYLAPWIESRK